MSGSGDLSKPASSPDTSLTDLFTFLSHLEYSPDMVEALKDYNPEARSRLESLLRTYHLNPEVEKAIWYYFEKRSEGYGRGYIKDDTPVENSYVQELLQPIKDRCIDEINNIWTELGIC
jgi:hypothetical protein